MHQKSLDRRTGFHAVPGKAEVSLDLAGVNPLGVVHLDDYLESAGGLEACQARGGLQVGAVGCRPVRDVSDVF